MGTPVLPELVDFEIRDIIVTLNNLSFIQTKACCSGWTGANDVSDGVNRTWVGKPYLLFESLENTQFFTDFIPFVMSKMIFDILSQNAIVNIDEYEQRINQVGLTYDLKQLVHFDMEYRNDRICVSMHLNDENGWTNVEKIWNLFRNVVSEYLTKEN